MTRMVRFRIVGDDAAVSAVIAGLHGMDKVDRVEEVADQMHSRDDVSSLGLVDDEGPDFHCIEVHVVDASATREVYDRVELAVRELDAVVEFLDEF